MNNTLHRLKVRLAGWGLGIGGERRKRESNADGITKYG
jgi:hypothetical protein